MLLARQAARERQAAVEADLAAAQSELAAMAGRLQKHLDGAAARELKVCGAGWRF
jgi:hypothetical protein